MTCRTSCSFAPRALSIPLALLLVVSALALAGCNDEANTPTDPETTTPALAYAAAAPALTQLSTYGQSTCGITAAGRAYCWGWNEFGQLGDGTTDDRNVAVPVTGDLTFRQISAGLTHACGVTTDDRAYCWGNNFNGELGDGTTTSTRQPVAVAGGLGFLKVSSGNNSSCAITITDRRAYCWGGNEDGQLGDGTTQSRLTPVAVAGGQAWRELSGGGFFTCGITTANLAYCWGGDDDGELGDGPERVRRLAPSAVAGGHRFTQLGAGYRHVCAVTTEQRAYCWGFGARGHIGDAHTADRYVPTAVAGGLTVDRVAVGGGNACAETAGNRTYCWGENEAGQIGNGVVGGFRFRPFEVASGLRFAQVAVGIAHACGRTSAHASWCWGRNYFGQLGDGTNTDHSTPTPVVSSN